MLGLPHGGTLSELSPGPLPLLADSSCLAEQNSANALPPSRFAPRAPTPCPKLTGIPGVHSCLYQPPGRIPSEFPQIIMQLMTSSDFAPLTMLLLLQQLLAGAKRRKVNSHDVLRFRLTNDRGRKTGYPVATRVARIPSGRGRASRRLVRGSPIPPHCPGHASSRRFLAGGRSRTCL